jgi:hypothetical protein
VPLQARLGRLLRRGQKNPDGKAAGLCRELTKWWAALWTFARVEGVEPTNNVAERALRPAVLWRKGSFGSDSEVGSQFAERLLTVVATCRQQGRHLLDFLVAAGEAALHGTAAPSLLPAPQGDRTITTNPRIRDQVVGVPEPYLGGAVVTRCGDVALVGAEGDGADQGLVGQAREFPAAGGLPHPGRVVPTRCGDVAPIRAEGHGVYRFFVGQAVHGASE